MKRKRKYLTKHFRNGKWDMENVMKRKMKYLTKHFRNGKWDMENVMKSKMKYLTFKTFRKVKAEFASTVNHIVILQSCNHHN